ncbi:MAG TPA: HAMP domain-containing sensor histidine kinase [Azospirillaceae bacterium]|nr:HAMP domain-containing sensor histidine kinase [Azospirillaceae bacterium]
MRRPGIGLVLLTMALAALLLPLSGIWVLRLYESALVRQTESELIAQAALVAAAYRAAWRAAGGSAEEGVPVDPRWTRAPGYDAPWLPRGASLDLADDPVLPPPPDPSPAATAPSPAALAAGAALGPVLREAQRTTLAGMRVVDARGTAVAGTGEAAGGSLLGQEEVARALAGEPVSVLRRRGRRTPPPLLGPLARNAEVRVFTALPVLEGDRAIGAVLLSRTPSTIGEALYGKRWHLAGLSLLLLAAVGGLAWLGAAAIGRPLRAVTDQAKRAARGERGAMAHPAPAAVREVAELAAALSTMAGTLERRADYIRDFAAHVSHEFKTPLTTIRGTVELLRDHLDEMGGEERARFLGHLDQEAERLSRLVRRLLELARADVARPAGTADAGAVLEALAARHRAAGLAVTLDISDPGPFPMAEEALEAVAGHLLDNAARHAGAGAHVTLLLRREGGEAVLTVADDGPGIAAADRERVFAPFFTTARASGGTGLGLAIVRSLVAAHGGTVALLDRPGTPGAAFEVRLPSPPPGSG